MMLQRVKKWIGINPPQPRPDEKLPYKVRKTLKKRHTRATRRAKMAS